MITYLCHVMTTHHDGRYDSWKCASLGKANFFAKFLLINAHLQTNEPRPPFSTLATYGCEILSQRLSVSACYRPAMAEEDVPIQARLQVPSAQWLKVAAEVDFYCTSVH